MLALWLPLHCTAPVEHTCEVGVAEVQSTKGYCRHPSVEITTPNLERK
jgi:hypothetical protein